ncbi:MAG: hypothetical protein KDN22_20825 [Verrucomicrobiae bacterium]|nr:hypothetical protein [Verrucomicrobiae bacterium]
MTQDLLERPDVGAVFKEVGCGRLELALHRGFMKVMSGDFSGSRMGADFCRGSGGDLFQQLDMSEKREAESLV